MVGEDRGFGAIECVGVVQSQFCAEELSSPSEDLETVSQVICRE